MQFFAPVVCLFAGQGLGSVVQMLPARTPRRCVVAAALFLYLGLASASLLLDVVRPYKLLRDQKARQFAAWFWESLASDAELACARTDLGLTLDIGHWDMHFTEYYLCYQRMYFARRRQKLPLRVELISDNHPLRCVFFNESPERSPLFQSWLAAMKEQFVHRGAREYTVLGEGPRGLNFANRYIVHEFAPRDGRVARSIPGMDEAKIGQPILRR
jgi:hypothetical protein